MKKTLFTKALSAILVLLVVFVINYSNALAAFVDGTQAKFVADFASYEEEQAAAAEFNIELAGESFVLMKNEGQALPLTPSEKYVSLFGTRSDNIILGGAGSGGGSAADSKTVKESLENVGIKLNPSLVNLYAMTTATNELPLTDLDKIISSYSMYKDAAIVVISRTGSEFNDAALYAVAGHSNLLDHYYSLDDNEKDLINDVGQRFDKVVIIINSAHPIEMAWLEDHDDVDSILWIGHPGTTGIMALGQVLVGEINPSGKTSDVWPAQFASDPTWPNFKGNIQSQLVIGLDEEGNEALFTNYVSQGHEDNVKAPLNNGTDGIASNDWDYYSYSRVTDKDGRTVTADGPAKGARYYATLDYEEGIYMGYRWYETADAEGYFDANNRYTVSERLAATPDKYAMDLYYNRLDGVVYPFGYGLSYTTFDVEITSARHNGNSFAFGSSLNTSYGQEMTLNVSVKNTGLIAGKKVVQVYYSAPYFTSEIEKSSVVLVEFAKSKLLQPGQTEVIQITFKIQDMASFDYNDANGSGHAGYELDPGTYTIGIYDSSHVVLDSIQAEVVGAVVNYDIDSTTGADIQVRFTGDGVWDGTRSDLDYYDSRRTELVSETPMTYLSRANFHGTFPQAPTASDLKWTDDAILILQSQVYYTAFNDLETDPWYKEASDLVGWTQASAADVTARVNGKTQIQLWEMSGVAFDDPRWDDFLNQLTYDELKTLISSTSFSTPALDAIGKTRSIDQDGPAQFSSGTFWVSEVNIASTWNTDLAYKQGLFVGNESLFLGIQGWYGPGLNIHRNPAAGRNFEYYSQDGLHSGKIAAAVIKGASDKGVTVYMKHLFLNDQETSRYTASTFLTEQALREIYAKPWELAIKEGKATASMTAFNKVGLLSTTSHYELYVGLLRDEFGFRESSVTDMYGWGYSPGTTGDMSARVNVTPLGTWANSFGRNVGGEWSEIEQAVVVTFTEDITNGTKWTKDDVTGTSSVAISSSNPVSINKINNRDFVDYDTQGILVDYDASTMAGPSAAYSDATTMKNGTALYEQGDTIVSYTQWYAVRTAAKSQLYAQVNSNAMRNGVVIGNITGRELTANQGTAISSVGLDVTIENLPDAVYTIAAGSRLPEGLTLNPAGQITGTATESGTFNVRITGTSSGYISATVDYTLTVVSVFTTTGIDNLLITVPFEGNLNSATWAVGQSIGSSTVTLVSHQIIEGRLPEGVTFADGKFEGTPQEIGSFNVLIGTVAETTNSRGRVTTYNFKSPITIVVGSPASSIVTFDGNFTGATVEGVVVTTGQKVSPLAAPYRPGYVFAGWFTDQNASVAVDFDAVIDDDVTLYAGWVAISSSQDALEAALGEINAKIAEINTKLNDASISVDDIEDIIATINQAITAINAALEDSETDNSAKIAEINEAITRLNGILVNTNAKVDAVDQKVDDTNPNTTLVIIAFTLGILGVLGSTTAIVLPILKKK